MADDSILSHPEILPLEKLIDILSSRAIPKEELLGKDKDVLVQLFYRYVVPLPQRTSHMRRANRLRKHLNPVKSLNSETKDDKRGLKRKHPHHGMDEAIKAAKVLKFLHQENQYSPTTECTKQITKLTVNCMTKKLSRPVKLNRTFLKNEPQTKIVLSSPSPNINNQEKNITRTTTSMNDCLQESTSSDSQVDSCEEGCRKSKKFKRISVTWP